MCLTSKTKEPKIAKRNIICYKWVCDKGTFYKSPYRGERLEKGVLNIAKGHSSIIESRIDNKTYYTIGEGFIHAYTNNKKSGWAHIVPCIIPKGAKYYKDAFMHEICADKMIIGKEYKLTLKERILKLFGY